MLYILTIHIVYLDSVLNMYTLYLQIVWFSFTALVKFEIFMVSSPFEKWPIFGIEATETYLCNTLNQIHSILNDHWCKQNYILKLFMLCNRTQRHLGHLTCNSEWLIGFFQYMIWYTWWENVCETWNNIVFFNMQLKIIWHTQNDLTFTKLVNYIPLQMNTPKYVISFS